MITQHQGLLLGIILLVTMSIICQLTNYFDNKDMFFNLENELKNFKPYEQSMDDLVKMNDIKHINIEKCNQIPCTVVQQPHAKIPCSVLRACGLTNNKGAVSCNGTNTGNGAGEGSTIETPYQFSPEDLKTLHLSTYHDVGREIVDRNMISSRRILDQMLAKYF